MKTQIAALLYYDGNIENSVNGITFSCRRPKLVYIDENSDFRRLKNFIHQSLKLQNEQTISNIIYKAPAKLNPMRFPSLSIQKRL